MNEDTRYDERVRIIFVLGSILIFLLIAIATYFGISSAIKGNKVEELYENIVEVKEEKNELVVQITTLTSIKEEKESQIVNLQSSIASKETTIETLTAEKSTLVSEKETLLETKTSLETQIESKDDSIEMLTEQLAEVNAKITDLNSKISAKDTQISTLTSEKETLATQLASANSEIATLNTQITDLTNKLGNANKATVFYVSGESIKGTYVVEKGEDVSPTGVLNPVTIENMFGIWPEAPKAVSSNMVVFPIYKSASVSLSGDPIIGATLTATYTGELTGEKYTWYRGEEVIAGVTTSTYTVTSSDVGKEVKVVVSKDGYVGTTSANTITIVDRFSIDWRTTAFFGSKSLLDFVSDECFKNIIFGKTSDYTEEIKNLSSVKVGEQSYDDIYAYYDPEDNTSVYILAALPIVFTDNDLKITSSETYGLFNGPYSVERIVLRNIDTKNLTSGETMFAWCNELKSVDLTDLDTSNFTSMKQMFGWNYNLESLDLSKFNTAKVEDMNSMFNSDSALTSLNFSSFNTSSVKDFSYMFEYCSNITSLDLSTFNTESAENMESMFKAMNNLTSLNISSFNTKNVTNMGYMFYDVSKLTTLDVSSFDTRNVESTRSMFESCKSLTSIDVTSFDTSNVKEMYCMFRNCDSITTLDISSFSTTKLESVYQLFDGCDELVTIYVSNKFVLGTFDSWNCYDMFAYCPKLVGGAGTTYSYSKRGIEYAVVDTATTPGYFTLKA